MKAGDTAYLVESNRFVREVEILRCNGELYVVRFKDTGGGLQVKAHRLFLTSEEAEVLIRLQCIKFRKIHMIIGIEDIGKRIVIILKLLLSIGENHR